ncbi:hypothetical protein PRZ48_014150 [Zasmidium cellare]|uniref:Uncharacterized protein n=1 Tax=Zasmidium cellare TaxID=395010 RepID=A0ABR0E062_ZASCE|nr:hypothetical protein PRZ48_014150 [Zasmidium cellare]
MDELTNRMHKLTTGQTHTAAGAAPPKPTLTGSNYRNQRRRYSRWKNRDRIIRMHALPPELFDIIHDLVFTPTSQPLIWIDSGYKPPFQLHVSRSARETFATQYYSTNTFAYDDIDIHLFAKFLKSLPTHHRLAIRFIHIRPFEEWSTVPRHNLAAGQLFRNLRETYGDGVSEMLSDGSVITTRVRFRREGRLCDTWQRKVVKERDLVDGEPQGVQQGN